MPGKFDKGGKEVKTETHDRIFFAALLVLALLAFSLKADAQVLRQGDTEAIVTSLSIPCEPGEMQFGLYPCPPISSQGVLIHVRADDWRTAPFDSYSITVNYTTATGEKKTISCGSAESPCPKRERTFDQAWDDGWRAVGFNIGRVQTPTLTGITVDSITVAKVPIPVVITIGKTDLGAPK